ncbi:MAG: RsmB/NOP family class I SAM-dependent RNA methyltransferase [Polyangiales bacterium]
MKSTDDEIAQKIAIYARRGEGRASALVAEAFKAHPDLDAFRRKSIAETAYGLLRWSHVLENLHARTDGDRLAFRAKLDDARTRDALLKDITDVPTLGSLPRWLGDRLVEEFGDKARDVAIGLATPPRTCLRANHDRDALVAALAEARIESELLPRTKMGVVLRDGAYDLYATKAWHEGRFEVQDEGSQLVAELVAPPPGGVVIDACAGEGGKTLAIASMLKNKGRVIGCDVSPEKPEVLKKRARKAGFNNVQTFPLNPDGSLPRALPPADRVLVDAPCSGIGSFRRNPEARFRIDAGALSRLPIEQRAIVDRFLPLVAPGGRLIYATCTILRAENDDIVDAIGEPFVPMTTAEIWGKTRALELGDGARLRLRPDSHGTDGFFAAVVRRPR